MFRHPAAFAALARRAPPLALLAALGGCGSPPPAPVTLLGEGFDVRVDVAHGSFDVTLADGRTVLEHAFAEVELTSAAHPTATVFRTTKGYTRRATSSAVTDRLGNGTQVEVRCTDLAGAPDLRLLLTAYAGRPFLTATVKALNPGPDELVLERLVPAKVEATRGGALWLGADPATHRILEDGSFFLFDFYVDIVPGDAPRPLETVALAMIHGHQQGHSISNWNHAIKDLATGRTFVAGSLDFEHASPMLNTSFVPEEAAAVDGRTPFTYWSAEFPYLPAGKRLGPGESLTAGPVLILPETADPLAGLETYAAAVKDWNDIHLWTERGADHRVPTGWNSWSGSGSSGGYGADIDEDLMLQNLDVMATEFRDFGGEWFQIDDGYEPYYGDWDWRPDRFPHGSAWMAEAIAATGLLPGIWIAPFQVDEASATHAAHEADGWFAERLPLFGGDKPIVDLTHPEVQAWLTDRFQRIRADGFRWVKTDFVYWALGAAGFGDPGATREEAYRRGLAAIRDGLAAGGEAGDTFWLAVSMLGPHLGFVDSLRPNLDTMPAWDREQEESDPRLEQGFKPTVRMMARRYYLQNRVFLFNHDMLFFRSHLDPSVPPITPDESRCLLTAMGLSGSVAKLGERLVDMQPAWIADYRTVIPVFGHAARPLDLFERDIPERWHLHVVPAAGLNTGGDGPPYDVVALFNWGTNRDLTTNPYTDMADAAREVSVDLGDLGLDPQAAYVAREFWSGEVTAGVTGTLTRTVAPHTVQLFALRPLLDRPQYVGGNRHLLQGAVEVRALAWDDGARTLTMTYDAAPGTTRAPFEHQLVFHVPAGWTLAAADVAGAAPGTTRTAQDGATLTVAFEVTTRTDAQLTLRFSGP